ncbi:hypothetical protein TWF128_007746 [Orbilia oligospora]|nr:hypothetical protein TWF128_007746 [Orbilia oligospora]
METTAVTIQEIILLPSHDESRGNAFLRIIQQTLGNLPDTISTIDSTNSDGFDESMGGFVIPSDIFSIDHHHGLPSKPPLLATTKAQPYISPVGFFDHPVSKTIHAISGKHLVVSMWDHVGWGVVGQAIDRQPKECVYERANMAHLDLCMNQYQLKESVVKRDSKDKKLAAAVFRLGETKCEWEEDHIATEILKTSIQIYTITLPEDPGVEVDLLIARQRLLGIYMYLGVGSFDSSIDIEYTGRENDEIRQRLKIEQQNCTNVYRLSVKFRNMESPGWIQTMYLLTLNNCALVYQQQGELRKAEEYLDKGVEIWRETSMEWHSAAIGTLGNLGELKTGLQDYVGACECFRRAVAGSEANYGLSNTPTLRLLENLRKTYIELGQFGEAEQIAEKIAQGENTLNAFE